MIVESKGEAEEEVDEGEAEVIAGAEEEAHVWERDVVGAEAVVYAT